MTKCQYIQVRVTTEEKAVLERAAKLSGCSMSEYVRAAVAGFGADSVAHEFRGVQPERRVATDPDQKFAYPDPHELPGRVSPPLAKPKRQRSEMCEHRVPADQFCKTCDR